MTAEVNAIVVTRFVSIIPKSSFVPKCSFSCYDREVVSSVLDLFTAIGGPEPHSLFFRLFFLELPSLLWTEQLYVKPPVLWIETCELRLVSTLVVV